MVKIRRSLAQQHEQGKCSWISKVSAVSQSGKYPQDIDSRMQGFFCRVYFMDFMLRPIGCIRARRIIQENPRLILQNLYNTNPRHTSADQQTNFWRNGTSLDQEGSSIFTPAGFCPLCATLASVICSTSPSIPKLILHTPDVPRWELELLRDTLPDVLFACSPALKTLVTAKYRCQVNGVGRRGGQEVFDLIPVESS